MVYKVPQGVNFVIHNLMTSRSSHPTPTRWASIATHFFPTVFTPEQCLVLERATTYLSHQLLSNSDLSAEVFETITKLAIARQAGHITEMEQSMVKLSSLFPVSQVSILPLVALIIYLISSMT